MRRRHSSSRARYQGVLVRVPRRRRATPPRSPGRSSPRGDESRAGGGQLGQPGLDDRLHLRAHQPRVPPSGPHGLPPRTAGFPRFPPQPRRRGTRRARLHPIARRALRRRPRDVGSRSVSAIVRETGGTDQLGDRVNRGGGPRLRAVRDGQPAGLESCVGLAASDPRSSRCRNRSVSRSAHCRSSATSNSGRRSAAGHRRSRPSIRCRWSPSGSGSGRGRPGISAAVGQQPGEFGQPLMVQLPQGRPDSPATAARPRRAVWRVRPRPHRSGPCAVAAPRWAHQGRKSSTSRVFPMPGRPVTSAGSPGLRIPPRARSAWPVLGSGRRRDGPASSRAPLGLSGRPSRAVAGRSYFSPASWWPRARDG